MTASEKHTVRAGYDLVATSYTADRTNAGAGGDIELLDAFLTQLPPDSQVLDAGCGAGIPVGDRVVDAGHALVGLDFSISQLGLAHADIPASRLVQGDLTALPVASATVDAVVSFYAIIHVPRDEHARVFEECHRVLRPGGRARCAWAGATTQKTTTPRAGSACRCSGATSTPKPTSRCCATQDSRLSRARRCQTPWRMHPTNS